MALKGMHLLSLYNSRKVRIADRIEVADTLLRRLVGLLGRKQLAAGEGLWIKPSSGVHTMGMSFPIDVVGLDEGGDIVRLWRRLAPYRMTIISWRVRSVIELPAGSIDHCSLRLGARLSLEELYPVHDPADSETCRDDGW
jgi:uncharacterized membrane protein (UPF0127 family)